MKVKIFTIFLFQLIIVPLLTAQDINLYFMRSQTGINNDTVGFISLSDIYPLSAHPDSQATPDLSQKEKDVIQQYRYFRLSREYRKRFLLNTNISDTDKVFIYSYSKNILISFPVSNLNVVASLNIYGADWPYSQQDYMIGFEINKKHLKGFERSFVNTLVYIGKKCPFILNQMKPIVWKKVDTKTVPTFELDSSIENEIKRFHYGNHKKGEAYIYTSTYLEYYIQNIMGGKNYNAIIGRYLIVVNRKTKIHIRSEIFFEHESASPAPLNFVESKYIEQWTGKLFKNKPPVILGLEYVSFGCPDIIILDSQTKDIYINCDSRH